MKIADILDSVKAAQPKLFTKINDPLAKRFAAALLESIGKAIDGAPEGPIVIAKLGRFNIKQIPTKDDSKTKVRRVVFVRSKIIGKDKK